MAYRDRRLDPHTALEFVYDSQIQNIPHGARFTSRTDVQPHLNLSTTHKLTPVDHQVSTLLLPRLSG
jgi:hypothetical protein